MSNLKYKYEPQETPEERLRNLLQPYLHLAYLGEHSKDAEVKEIALLCNENTEKIKDILDDMSTLYGTIDLTKWIPNITK